MNFSLARMQVAVAWFAVGIFFAANWSHARAVAQREHEQSRAKDPQRSWICPGCFVVPRPLEYFEFPSGLLAIPALGAAISTLRCRRWQTTIESYQVWLLMAAVTQWATGGPPRPFE